MPIKILNNSGQELFLYNGDSLIGADLRHANLIGAARETKPEEIPT